VVTDLAVLAVMHQAWEQLCRRIDGLSQTVKIGESIETLTQSL
jgi:hypothetical protein